MKKAKTFILKISSLLLGFALSSHAGKAQLEGPLDVDRLRNELSRSMNDTSRVLTLASLGEAYRSSNPDSALYFGQSSLTLAREIKFPRGEIHALLSICVVVRELGNFQKALTLGLNALRLAEENKYLREEEFCLIRIGNVYLTSQNYPLSLHYYQLADQKLKIAPDKVYSIFPKVFAGYVYERMNRVDSALYYEQQAAGEIFQFKDLAPLYLQVLGNIQFKLGNYQQALAYYQLGIGSTLERHDYRNASQLFISKANLYKKAGQADSAIYNAKQGLAYGERITFRNRIMDAASLLSQLYEGSDDKESLRFLKIANETRDSMYSREKLFALQSTTFEEQERQKEILAARTAYEHKITTYAMWYGIIVLVALTLVFYRSNRQKQKANVKIEQAYHQLKATQQQLIHSEKLASLGELTAGIAHEIQNPLNFVNNFSEVNVELLNEMKEAIRKGNIPEVSILANDMEKNMEKISAHGKRADSIVKGMLQHSRTGSGKKEPTDLNNLCDEYLRLAYHGLRAKDISFNVEFKTSFDTSIGQINILPQEMGRVLLNLFNNAFYAANERVKKQEPGYHPMVSVTTSRLDDQILISVKDNGRGIPEKIQSKIFQPFFTTKPTGQGTGLGLSLSYDIVKAHGGELSVESKEGEGSSFIVSLPVEIK